MLPYKNIDISWSNLFSTVVGVSSKSPDLTKEIEKYWPKNNILFTYSVRTCLHYFFQVAGLPKNAEVLIVGMTIGDVFDIIEWNHLVPKSLAIDSQTLFSDYERFLEAINPRTKVVVVTHLFGSYNDISKISQHCKQKNIHLIEDCAQAFCFPGFQGNQYSDLVLFSFGLAKKSTALGGAIAIINDPKLKNKIEEKMFELPVQSSLEFYSRVVSAFFLKVTFNPYVYSAIYKLSKLFNYDLDKALSQSSVFKKKNLIKEISKKPNLKTTQLWLKQMATFSSDSVVDNTYIQKINTHYGIKICGSDASISKYYSVVLYCEDPDKLTEHLKQQNIDCTMKDNLKCILPYDCLNNRIYVSNQISFKALFHSLKGFK